MKKVHVVKRWFCLRRWEDGNERIQYRFGLEGYEYFGVSYPLSDDPLLKQGEIYEVNITITPDSGPRKEE